MEGSGADRPIVIVGAGHAGSQLAFSLRQGGNAGRIVLVDGEGETPYQRPPLSKAFLSGKIEAEELWFRPQAFYDEQRIELKAGRAIRIDRGACRLRLADGAELAYGHLVLATGGHARSLELPGAGLAGVQALRTIADARRLQPLLAKAKRVAVIGGGFIGLEFAAVAARQGLPVTVIEALDRPMARAASPAISQLFQDAHAGWGVQWRLGCPVLEILGHQGSVAGLRCGDGELLEADLIVYGIGMIPHIELAREAGLDVASGIVVDAQLSTVDAHISALGDGAVFPDAYADRMMRYESVQNAADQARYLAARLLGNTQEAYVACPWFWSDQGDLKLQIAGLPSLCQEFVALDGAAVLGFTQGRLRAVETVNRPAEHMLARRLLAAGKSPLLIEARETAFDFKAWARAALAA